MIKGDSGSSQSSLLLSYMPSFPCIARISMARIVTPRIFRRYAGLPRRAALRRVEHRCQVPHGTQLGPQRSHVVVVTM